MYSNSTLILVIRLYPNTLRTCALFFSEELFVSFLPSLTGCQVVFTPNLNLLFKGCRFSSLFILLVQGIFLALQRFVKSLVGRFSTSGIVCIKRLQLHGGRTSFSANETLKLKKIHCYKTRVVRRV